MKLIKYLLFIFLFIPFCVHASGYEIVSGDLDTIGSIIKIADEEFYVIRKEDDTHIRLLSKLNLGVGEGVTNQVNRQSTESGIVEFSSTKYWWDEENKDFKSPYLERKIILNQDNMDDKSYVYNENSTVYSYVEDYEEYLNTQDVCVSAELIRREDLFALGCNDACVRCHGFTYFCYPDPIEWLYGDYWIGDAPMYQLSETTDPFESDPAYFSVGSHFFFSRAPVARVSKYEMDKRHSIRPVITLDLENTCKIEETVEEPQEEKEEIEEEKYENPPTGAFISITLLILLIIISLTTFIIILRKNKFKRI